MTGLGRDELRTLLTDLGAADFGTWRHEDVVAACTKLGWEVSRDQLPRCETAAVPGVVRGAYLTENWDRRHGGDSEMMQVYLCAAVITPEAFRDYLAVATEVWGEPSLYGGNGDAFVRWRGKTTTRQLEVSYRGDLTVRVFATEAWEGWDYRSWEYGEGLGEVPYTWIGEDDHPSLIGCYFGGRLVHSWDELAEALAMTLRDIHFGMRTLGTGNTSPSPDHVVVTLAAADPVADDTRWLQLSQDLEELVMVTSPEGRSEEVLREHGFAPDEYGAWTREFLPGPETAETAAKLAVTLLGEFGLAEPAQVSGEYFRNSSPYRRFSLHCFGVERSR
ncbi:hypothetical protein [Nocardia sp. XZ_19_385]|uniref:hypothetical protein n=1 Tax=Nocardia sp. XZ_19_385 TaxID=2769488 RepID=UPI00188EF6CD|nr:hypothetical protein [Nocardia sp. XZ_19_385]